MTQPIRDQAMVTPQGESLAPLPAGVSFYDVVTQVDERGTVCEMFHPGWGWNDAPLVSAYTFTIRPGIIKGWGLHQAHEDRYFILFGEMEVVLYDARPDSPTYGLVAKVILSEYRRRAMNIPAGIWHADHNIGNKDVVCVNFPTVPYDHANPDKLRLPIDTDQIPYRFEKVRGG